MQGILPVMINKRVTFRVVNLNRAGLVIVRKYGTVRHGGEDYPAGIDIVDHLLCHRSSQEVLRFRRDGHLQG